MYKHVFHLILIRHILKFIPPRCRGKIQFSAFYRLQNQRAHLNISVRSEMKHVLKFEISSTPCTARDMLRFNFEHARAIQKLIKQENTITLFNTDQKKLLIVWIHGIDITQKLRSVRKNWFDKDRNQVGNFGPLDRKMSYYNFPLFWKVIINAALSKIKRKLNTILGENRDCKSWRAIFHSLSLVFPHYIMRQGCFCAWYRKNSGIGCIQFMVNSAFWYYR